MSDVIDRNLIEARIAACHESVRSLYAYWRRKAAGRAMPRRADIDPAEIKSYLPAIILVDVVPDARRFVYRLAGTSEVAERGYDPTGKTVAESHYGGSVEETLFYYQYTVDHHAPCCCRDPFPGPDGRIETEDIIYLPLSEDGGSVNMILVFTHNYAFRARTEATSLLR